MMIRAVVVCLFLAMAVSADESENVTEPSTRVVYFDEELVASRDEAIAFCARKYNMPIAHESQLIADLEDGYTGHHKCGWTWVRGRPVYAHCNDSIAGKCLPGQSSIMKCGEVGEENFGVYCRIFADDEDRPRFEVNRADLVDIFVMQGPAGPNTIMSVNEAKAICEDNGAVLAYWSQVSSLAERYNFQLCHYSWFYEQNAVYRANCDGNQLMEWAIRDQDQGYDAVCYGSQPSKYTDPCKDPYPIVLGHPVVCSEDGWIIIQSRPECKNEKYCFRGKEWQQYKFGFGEHGKGYWLGLLYVSLFTNNYKAKLKIIMEAADGTNYTAIYDSFRVGPERPGKHDQYELIVDGYHGDAGDMFNTLQSNKRTTNGAFFSTPIHDNDGDFLETNSKNKINCAKEFNSGWWFQFCHVDNLNGLCDDENGFDVSTSKMRTWQNITRFGGRNGTSKGPLRRTWMMMTFVSDDTVPVQTIEYTPSGADKNIAFVYSIVVALAVSILLLPTNYM